MQKTKLCRPQDIDDDVLLLFLSLDPFLILAAVDHIELARAEGEIAGRVRWNQAINNAVNLRGPAEILLVSNEDHALIRLVGFELERPGSDWIEPEIISKFLYRLAADDHATVIVGDKAKECRHGLLQLDAHRRRIDRLDGLDRSVVGIEGRGLRIGRPLEREHHVVSGELAVVAMK